MWRKRLNARGIFWLLLAVGGLFALAADGGQKPDRNDKVEWRVADGVTYENLTVFPVVSRQAADTQAFETLDEALQSGDAVVSESGGDAIVRSRDGRPVAVPYSGGAQVNQLVLVNRGKRPVVLLAGELLSGGKQDRIVAKDRIVAPGAPPLPLDVFCVEHGRWSSGTKFAASVMIVHPSVREKAAVDQAQTDVWAAVRKGSTAGPAGGMAGLAAPAAPPPLSEQSIEVEISRGARTEAYAKIYGGNAGGVPVDSFAEEIERRFARATSGLKDERVVGVVVAYGGDVAWSDVFASLALFESYWPKLIRSYVVEALARPQLREAASRDDARDFMRPLAGNESTESEPGVYRWREINEGHYTEIALEALHPLAGNARGEPQDVMLHWLKIHRTN